MSEYIHIGKIVAAHGLTGHLILEHALGTPIHFKGIDAIFIEKIQLVLFPILYNLPLLKPKV
jgi:16S rRNA processing protein RimM